MGIVVRNVVKSAPKTPQPGKVYGARMDGLTLNGKSVTAHWVIYGHKNRGRKKGGPN